MSNRIKTLLEKMMKGYEDVPKFYLIKKVPVIIRLDGKAFSTFTKGFEKPFDVVLLKCMHDTTKYLCENIQGCKLAYTQSDEISLLLTDYESANTQAWFEYNLEKMVSTSAALATSFFNKTLYEIIQKEEISIKDKNFYMNKLFKASFDSRVFNIPKEEVANYFIWRQQDAMRNSVSMFGRSKFSAKELNGKPTKEVKEMLKNEGIVWEDIDICKQRGTCIKTEPIEIYSGLKPVIRNKWVIDDKTPIFSEYKEYIDNLI